MTPIERSRIRVGHHDQEVLRAAQRLDPLARLRGGLVHGSGDRGGPTKEMARM